MRKAREQVSRGAGEPRVITVSPQEIDEYRTRLAIDRARQLGRDSGKALPRRPSKLIGRLKP